MNFEIIFVNSVNHLLDEETEIAINTPTVDYSANPYCFRFTWLGPKFDNESVFLNATCNDFVKGATNVPCQLPLVVSGLLIQIYFKKKILINFFFGQRKQ